MIKLSKDSHVELVEAFIKLGADVHVQDDFALIYASEYGQLDVVKCLIKNGAGLAASPRPDKVGNDYALIRASMYGHLEVVRCLIYHGANVHACNGDSLRWASAHGHLDVVEYLINNGAADGWRHLGDADIHAQNESPLYWAANNGHLAVVKRLIKYGSNNDLALRCASRGGHLDIAKYIQNN
jgi:ankyrin repeat protein